MKLQIIWFKDDAGKAYRGMNAALITDSGERLTDFGSTTGIYLRDLANCFRFIDQSSLNPTPSTLTIEIIESPF